MHDWQEKEILKKEKATKKKKRGISRYRSKVEVKFQFQKWRDDHAMRKRERQRERVSKGIPFMSKTRFLW
jgi:hypothetical protein